MSNKIKGDMLKNSGKVTKIQEARSLFAIYAGLAALTFLITLIIILSWHSSR